MISTGVLLVYLHVIGRKGNDEQGTLLESSGIIVMPWDPKKNPTLWHVFDVTAVARSSKWSLLEEVSLLDHEGMSPKRHRLNL
jgi:hypothetical protein